MTQTWRSNPSFKVEVDSTEILDDSISVQVVRPECAISRATLVANDYEGKNFIANLDVFDTLKVSFRYGSDSWTKVFEGTLERVGPTLMPTGQLVDALAYGYGRAWRNMHCRTSYGAESENPTIDTPTEIWTDLKDNYINKGFGGGASGYSLTLSVIGGTSPTINYMHNPYRKCIDILNETLFYIQADQAGNPGHIWYVDTSGATHIRPIDDDNDANWREYWKTTQALSTLTEGEDFRDYKFNKQIREFANKIILATHLRKPGYDTWTESKDTSWGTVWATVDDVAVDSDTGALSKIVGDFMLEANPTGIPVDIYYPSTINANWDLTRIGAPNDPPRLNFYAAINDAAMTLNVRLYTTNLNNYFQYSIQGDFPQTKVFRWFSLPIGPYYHETGASDPIRWGTAGAPSWSNIDAIGFRWTPVPGAPEEFVWLDDLHFSGKLIREAYNSYSISGNVGPPAVTQKNEHQLVIRMDTSVDDMLIASDASGTAGLLAYAELLTHDKISTIGTITTTGGIVDILPGQKVYIEADYTGSAYRIDSDFRVKQIIHDFNPQGFSTTLEITDDLVNTFTAGPSEVLSILKKAVFADPEAQGLKVSGINPLVPRLSKDYPFDDD